MKFPWQLTRQEGRNRNRRVVQLLAAGFVVLVAIETITNRHSPEPAAPPRAPLSPAQERAASWVQTLETMDYAQVDTHRVTGAPDSSSPAPSGASIGQRQA